MKVPILKGIYANSAGDFRTAYPRNMVPIIKETGIGESYLRPSEGIVKFNDVALPGIDRGAINWEDVCYRVLGSKLVRVSEDGNVSIIGDVGSGSDNVSLTYSFDYLAVVSGESLFYLRDNGDFQKVTDPSVGAVKDIVWTGGYFVMTDGAFLVVTELNDPTTIDPDKYGSSEIDPDPIQAVHAIWNELYAVNRYTIEVFSNVGGTNFPFQRIDGAQITRGALGTYCTCVFQDTIAFIGGGRKEAVGIWQAVGGSSVQISSREINQILKGYTEKELGDSLIESRVDEKQSLLYIHLPDQTLVFDSSATEIAKNPIWFVLTSGIDSKGAYLAVHQIWCYNKWLAGDPTQARIGFMSNETSELYGEEVSWEFSTNILYNSGKGAVFHELELVGLSGRVTFGVDPVIDTQYSLDGEVWSQRRYIKGGRQGDRLRRLVWFSQGNMRNWRIQRFHGNSSARLSVSALEIRLQGLEV
jgi:hypothetical protein